MPDKVRVALVGNYNPASVAHQAIPEALRLCAAKTGMDIVPAWVPTQSILQPEVQLQHFQGIWCVPASPYASMEGALRAIRYARESNRPFLGTCGGFQHALIEYARSVCGLAEADHTESSPNSVCPVVTPLSCTLIEQSGEIVLQPESLVQRAYGALRITEGYHCSYGLNPRYESALFGNGLRPTAHDLSGEVRAIELSGHCFFVATLFQPERRALQREVPPLVEAFIAAQAAAA